MDLAIALDTRSPQPIYRQLYEELRQAILTGRLSPKEKLPSTRSLAKSLGISRTTVTQCYEQLIAEGYLQTSVGAGTFVSSQLPDDLDKVVTPQAIDPENSQQPLTQLSKYGFNLAQANLPGFKYLDAPISFKYGEPALDCFPFATWRKLFARHFGSNLDLLSYSLDLLGYRPLREAIALEDPGYLGARNAFEAAGAKFSFIPVDSSGLAVSKLLDAPRVKFVSVTPSHQFPTGAVLSLSRRLELLNWAQQTGTIIVEDDYDSEFRYNSRPIPALQGLDRHQLVIYMGTFSKVLFPALRIGYLVLPEHLVKVFAGARWVCDRQTPTIEQQVLADFINEGHLERHIRQMRQLYDRRRQALVRSLTGYLGERVEILGDNAGIHLMVKVESRRSDAEVIEAARQVGVGLVSTQAYYANKCDRGQFLFGYSQLNEEQIAEGVRRLSRIII